MNEKEKEKDENKELKVEGPVKTMKTERLLDVCRNRKWSETNSLEYFHF